MNKLPFPVFGSVGVPYYDNKDADGYLAMPVENYIRNASGLFVPVSATNPLPMNLTSSDAAYSAAEDSLKITSMQRKWRDDFPGNALNPGNWQVVQQGSEHAISVNNSALSMATGTAANTETIIRSTLVHTVPFRVMFIFYLSQRIANQEFYLEVTNASGTMLAQWLFDGTGATTGKINSANGGIMGSPGLVAIGNTGSYAITEIELFPDEVYFHARAADSTGARSGSFVRTRSTPDPNDLYYIQIRARNLGTAPTSSTTLHVDAVATQDIAELTAEITAGRGQMVGSQAIASHVTGVAPDVALSTVPYGVPYTDSTVPLGVNSIFYGTTRSLLHLNSGYLNMFRVRAYADQAGTLFVDQSRDGVSGTWRSTESITVAAGETKFLEAKVVARYVRVRYVNGATAQGAFELISFITST